MWLDRSCSARSYSQQLPASSHLSCSLTSVDSHPIGVSVCRVYVAIFLLLLLSPELLGQGSDLPDCVDINNLRSSFVIRAVRDFEATFENPLPDAPSAVSGNQQEQTPRRQTQQLPGFVTNVKVKSPQTDWNAAGMQSFLFLSIQHSLRLLQPKTRAELKGPVFSDYIHSIEGIDGWGDGDGIVTNYFMHPAMGSIASFVYIQNTPASRDLTFDAHSSAYWNSRLKAMAFAAAYSTQFEIGPISEAMIGNVGLHKGTNGVTDLVMTPVGGFGVTVLEDYLDKRFVEGLESHTSSPHRQRFYRIALNPERSLANLLRFRAPWYRDTRPMPQPR